jgi:hypothetical protein
VSYQLHYPSDDPEVQQLRGTRERLKEQIIRIDQRLDELLPTPLCRLCHKIHVSSSVDWTVCGYCWNKHNGKVPPPP